MGDASIYKQYSDKEKKILNDLNDFNQKYNLYLHCNMNASSPDCASYNNNAAINDLNSMYSTLDEEIKELTNALKITPIKQERRINSLELKNLYSQITQYRDDFDYKLKELNNSEDSIRNLYKQRYDSTVYTTVLLSALATSLLYYLFTKT
jgi:DNA repair exonuclease SbcCD ATPase subunit